MCPDNDTQPSGPPPGPLRYLIRCRRTKFEERGKSDTELIEKLAKHEHLDLDKIAHIGTKKNMDRVHIIFDYNNASHQRCTTRAFKGSALRKISLPSSAVDYLHWLVELWTDILQRNGGHFPVRTSDSMGAQRNQDPSSDNSQNETDAGAT